MKNIIIIIATLFGAIFKTQAQGNLQFSKVKLISNIQDTVPNGKVWKIESFIFSQSIPNCTGSTTVNQDEFIKINGQNISVRSSRFLSGYFWQGGPGGWNATPNSDYNIWEQKLPLWLPSGTSLSSDNGVLYISAIEYNVVQE